MLEVMTWQLFPKNPQTLTAVGWERSALAASHNRKPHLSNPFSFCSFFLFLLICAFPYSHSVFQPLFLSCQQRSLDTQCGPLIS